MTAYVKLAIAVAVLLAGFAAGWVAQGLRKDATIADMRASTATNEQLQAEGAISDLVAATASIKTAASEAQSDNKTVITKLSSIEKGLKNVQAKTPLPPDCKPDAGRVQSLNAAIEAANTAAARPVPSK